MLRWMILLTLIILQPVYALEKDFDTQLKNLQNQFTNTQSMLNELPEILQESLDAEKDAMEYYDRIADSIDDIVNQLEDDAELLEQINALQKDFNQAKSQYMQEYDTTGDRDYLEIAEAFGDLEIQVLENRDGILAERIRAKSLQEDFMALRGKAIAWVRLNRAEKAVQALAEFQDNFRAANDRLEDYVNQLSDANSKRIPMN